METRKKPSVGAFESGLTDYTVRSMQIIQMALGSGVFIFVVIVIAMYFTYASEPGAGGSNFIWILTLVHFTLAFVLFALSSVLYRRRLTEEAVSRVSPSGAVDVDACIAALRSAIVLRLGLLEGAAFYGLVVCIVAVMRGVMHENPFFWINLASAFVMLFFVVWLFPSRERLTEFYKNDFQF